MHIEELLKKYDLDLEIFNPMKRNSKEETEKNKEDPATTEEETTEDIRDLLTPYICRKDCIHYDPVKPSEAKGNKELIELCKLSDNVTPSGCDCKKYENKNEKDALELEGCLSFN